MPIIKVGPHEMDVDIRGELERYDWIRPRWQSDKLIAGSPFRPDNNPSFYVNLEGDYAGVFGDSGAAEDEYKSGGFVKLLAYLRGEYYEDTIAYLHEEYGSLYEITPDAPIRLPEITLRKQTQYKAPDGQALVQAVSPYLTMRDISKAVQQRYAIGYGANYKGFTALPWYTPDGRLANVKYRSTAGKTFFYEKDAVPVSKLVFGLDVINEDGAEFAVLCEGEIDALSWATAGIPAVAIGGSSMSDAQADAIKRSSIRRLALGGDNDKAGKRLNAEVARKLGGFLTTAEVDYGRHKDANEVLRGEGVDKLIELSNFTLAKLRENSLQLRNIAVK